MHLRSRWDTGPVWQVEKKQTYTGNLWERECFEHGHQRRPVASENWACPLTE